jgi:hypothetical protein
MLKTARLGCEKSEDEVIKQQEKLSGLLKTYIDSTTKYSEATDGATWHKSNANSAWKVGLGFVGAGLVGGAVTFFTLGNTHNSLNTFCFFCCGDHLQPAQFFSVLKSLAMDYTNLQLCVGLGLPFVIAGSALTGGAITSSVSHAVSNGKSETSL